MNTDPGLVIAITHLATYSRDIALAIEGQDAPTPEQWTRLHSLLAGLSALGNQLQLHLSQQD